MVGTGEQALGGGAVGLVGGGTLTPPPPPHTHTHAHLKGSLAIWRHVTLSHTHTHGLLRATGAGQAGRQAGRAIRQEGRQGSAERSGCPSVRPSVRQDRCVNRPTPAAKWGPSSSLAGRPRPQPLALRPAPPLRPTLQPPPLRPLPSALRPASLAQLPRGHSGAVGVYGGAQHVVVVAQEEALCVCEAGRAGEGEGSGKGGWEGVGGGGGGGVGGGSDRRGEGVLCSRAHMAMTQTQDPAQTCPPSFHRTMFISTVSLNT